MYKTVLIAICSPKKLWIFVKVEKDPQKIAAIFKESEELDSEALGVYLGSSSDLARDIGKAYFNLFPWSGLEPDDALRKLCSLIKLPGESQQIDRVLETLSEVFFKTNPSVGEDSQAIYTLFFILLMLNTDAHNAVIPAANKMTKENFLKMASGSVAGFDDAALGKLYDKVVANKIDLHKWPHNFWFILETLESNPKLT